ncbi:hypothetical protein CLPU_2c02570 [Gottschalkia purinilytica]|uniref:Phage holin family protein n=1 Tax=Gottschalkia purinilytica TaxID=1503 RepID=A0A0L0WEF6_GOTPU|nr:phage holin family protein [Gottschalkia purinilytica]KNF09805.1 hypothetical protein CLPU_2c02570 [Gottschalkia purinilytica]
MADREDSRGINISAILIRLLVTAIVVAISAFLTPGFTISGIWSLILATIVITALDYLIATFTGIDATPFGRGIVGFIVAALVLYLTKFIVAGFNITLLGAIIGALVIGIVDALIPGKAAL